jgi:hypothetical protein
MKKIRLDIDKLEVQSFATVHPDGARGTVQGAADVSYYLSYEDTCYQRVGGCGLRNETDLCITLELSCTCQPGQFPC